MAQNKYHKDTHTVLSVPGSGFALFADVPNC